MSEKKKELRITEITYDQYTDYEFQPPSTFFVMSSLQIYYFIHTSKRAEAQQWADDTFGVGKFIVKASKLQKTVPKSESGQLTVTGTATRKK